MVKGLVSDEVAQIARRHHASPDDPSVQKLTKILSVLDTYEALRNENRSYKDGKPHDKAIDIMKSMTRPTEKNGVIVAPTKLDEDLVDEFAEFTKKLNNPIRKMYRENPREREWPPVDPICETILNSPAVLALQERANHYAKHGTLLNYDAHQKAKKQSKVSLNWRVKSLALKPFAIIKGKSFILSAFFAPRAGALAQIRAVKTGQQPLSQPQGQGMQSPKF
jgi:hypothetical protein